MIHMMRIVLVRLYCFNRGVLVLRVEYDVTETVNWRIDGRRRERERERGKNSGGLTSDNWCNNFNKKYS